MLERARDGWEGPCSVDEGQGVFIGAGSVGVNLTPF